MISSLQAQEIDIAIGLTEGFVAALGNQGNGAGFKLVGTYVETPLCWAISTGADRDLDQAEQLKEKKCGVSRIGRYALIEIWPSQKNTSRRGGLSSD